MVLWENITNENSCTLQKYCNLLSEFQTVQKEESILPLPSTYNDNWMWSPPLSVCEHTHSCTHTRQLVINVFYINCLSNLLGTFFMPTNADICSILNMSGRFQWLLANVAILKLIKMESK